MKRKRRKIRRSVLVIGLLVIAAVVCAVLLSLKNSLQKEDSAVITGSVMDTKEKGTLIMEAQALYARQQEDLEELISAYLEQNNISEDSVQYCIEDLETNERYVHNETENVTAASIYKLPLAMIYYEKIAAGELDENTLFTYEANHYESGGPIGTTYAPGAQIPLEELLHCMILYSDNTAGHILYENLDGWVGFKKAITKYSEDEQEDYFFSYDNVLNASFIGDVLNYLYAHEDIFATLLEDMKKATPNDYLASSIQPEIAQKWGLYSVYRNAAGIVYGEHPYSIAIFTSLNENGIRVIGEINELCYEYFNGYEWTKEE